MTFIGKPIEGDKAPTNLPPEQAPDGDLELAFLKVFQFNEVRAVRWRQYTPYWNDGEPCLFHIYEIFLKFSTTGENDGDYGDGYVGAYDKTYKALLGEYKWVGNYESRMRVPVTSPNPALTTACWGLEAAITRGRHSLLLQELFGDHAIVTATREKFDIQFYEHD